MARYGEAPGHFFLGDEYFFYLRNFSKFFFFKNFIFSNLYLLMLGAAFLLLAVDFLISSEKLSKKVFRSKKISKEKLVALHNDVTKQNAVDFTSV